MDPKQPKLLMVIGLFYPFIGGAERECQKLSKKLQEQGYNVSVLTQYQEGLPAHEVIDAVPVYRKIRGWHLFEITYMLSVLIFLFRHRKQFDVICCFGLYLFTAPAILFSRIFGKRVFFRLECAGKFGDFKSISQLKLGNFILRCAPWADGIIAISREIEQELMNNGFSGKKIYRIPNSVDISMFCPRAAVQNDAAPIISYIGRLSRQKGLDTLLKAIRNLRERLSVFKIFIVGDGDMKPILQNMAEEYDLKTVVCFTGAVSNVIDYYQQSHIIVMPSYYEGLPLVLLEAMACGVPVVASRVGGITDVLGMPRTSEPEAGGYWLAESGLLIQPGDSEALAAAILRLVTDNGLRQDLARKGREKSTAYSLERVVEQYRQLFAASDG